SITGEHGVGMEKNELMPDLFSEPSLEMMARLKKLFDPEGLLNPGKVLPTGKGCMEIRQAPLRTRSAVLKPAALSGCYPPKFPCGSVLRGSILEARRLHVQRINCAFQRAGSHRRAYSSFGCGHSCAPSFFFERSHLEAWSHCDRGAHDPAR